MNVYSFDNVMFTHAKVPDEFDLQDARGDGEEQGRSGRRAAGAARVLARRSDIRNIGMPYHAGALKYFKETISSRESTGVAGADASKPCYVVHQEWRQ